MLPPNVTTHKDTFLQFLGSLEIPIALMNDEESMLTAFVHKSYAADFSGDFVYNERLEFLGDAILGAIVAKLLYRNFPTEPESTLTLYKIALVRAENFALVAQEIGLDKVILLWNGEERNNGRQKITILCDCLEAIIWYIYLDYGVDVVENLVEKYILTKLEGKTNLSVKSYKSHLQEVIQKTHKITPHYREIELGKDPVSHEIIYQSTAYMDEKILWEWQWTNKKKAQEQAAKDAYERMWYETHQ